MTTTSLQSTAARSAGRTAMAALALATIGLTGSALAGEVSVSKPVGQLFAPNAAQLSPSGERWLRSQVAPEARQPAHMVVVQIPGATPTLQEQRASVIRKRLAALGVASQQIYIEAAPLESESPSRVAGI